MRQRALAAAVVVALLASGGTFAQSTGVDVASISRVEPTILVPRLTYAIGEGIVMQLTLKNPSNVPVTVPANCLSGDAVTIQRVDRAAPERYSGKLKDGKALTIAPLAEAAIDLDVTRRWKVREAGHYRIAWQCGEWQTSHDDFYITTPYDKDRDRIAVVTTDVGTLEMVLMPEQAPAHVRNFVDLARAGFYDGSVFFRIIPGMQADAGDATGTGNGGWLNQLAPEIDPTIHPGKGLVGATRRESSMTSATMFFILLEAQPGYQGLHTFFAYVREGREVLDALSALETSGQTGDYAFRPLKSISIRHIEIKGP